MTEVLPGLPMFTRRLDLPDGNESLPTTLKMASATLPMPMAVLNCTAVSTRRSHAPPVVSPR